MTSIAEKPGGIPKTVKIEYIWECSLQIRASLPTIPPLACARYSGPNDSNAHLFPVASTSCGFGALRSDRWRSDVRRLLDASRVSNVFVVAATGVHSALVHDLDPARFGIGHGNSLVFVYAETGRCSSNCLHPGGDSMLSGDHLYLEHTVMADHLTIFLAAAGIWAAICGLVPNFHLRCLAAASALLAMAALTRSVGVVLLPILVLCTALWVKESFRPRCVAVAAALLPGMGVFALYIGGFYVSHGQYLGLTDMSGWNLYSRVAPFADCGKFTPPRGNCDPM